MDRSFVKNRLGSNVFVNSLCGSIAFSLISIESCPTVTCNVRYCENEIDIILSEE